MRTLIAIALVVILFSCDSNEGLPLTDSYLPLEIGNKWEFKQINGVNKDVTERREVVATKIINGKEYTALQISHLAPTWSGPPKDTLYLRVETNGYVYILRADTEFEENRYRLLGEDGDTWSYSFYNESEMDITLSISDVTIGNSSLNSCKSYYADVKQWADEEMSYTLAKGIGFARERSVAWGGGLELTSARIRGRVYSFN